MFDLSSLRKEVIRSHRGVAGVADREILSTKIYQPVTFSTADHQTSRRQLVQVIRCVAYVAGGRRLVVPAFAVSMSPEGPDAPARGWRGAKQRPLGSVRCRRASPIELGLRYHRAVTGSSTTVQCGLNPRGINDIRKGRQKVLEFCGKPKRLASFRRYL